MMNFAFKNVMTSVLRMTNLAKVGDESETIARAHEQVRELLEEKDEGLTAFKEMEAAALRLQEDIIKRCAERDNLL